jgi:hypothetical protein
VSFDARTTLLPIRESESVARRIEEAAEDDSWDVVEELLGETDCVHGCYVEPGGVCSQGWRSGGLRAGIV